ncbi:hypothetical protein, partial [uncultured Phocaeicola sp.]|uniref:hypothetical protein n=1 Tax=uncultured Phocaeicola sp. TaxID=990718 RepID=UPI0025A31054
FKQSYHCHATFMLRQFTLPTKTLRKARYGCIWLQCMTPGSRCRDILAKIGHALGCRVDFIEDK